MVVAAPEIERIRAARDAIAGVSGGNIDSHKLIKILDGEVP